MNNNDLTDYCNVFSGRGHPWFQYVDSCMKYKTVHINLSQTFQVGDLFTKGKVNVVQEISMKINNSRNSMSGYNTRE